MTARLESMLHGAAIEGISPAALICLCAAAALSVFVLLMVVSQTVPVAVVFAVMAGYGPVASVRGRGRKRRRELSEVWPEAVDNLASAVRAGLSLPEALTQLGDRGPDALRPAFGAFGQDYLATGRFGDCLDRLKRRLSDPVGDRIIEALRIAREVGGGDRGRMLRSLSRFLREDARTRAELESRQAWVVNSAHAFSPGPAVPVTMGTGHSAWCRHSSVRQASRAVTRACPADRLLRRWRRSDALPPGWRISMSITLGNFGGRHHKLNAIVVGVQVRHRSSDGGPI